MRTLALALAVLGSGTLARAQELISNHSFEQSSACPTTSAELALAAPWIAPTPSTPDYFNACNVTPDSVGTPANSVGVQAPYHGDAYAGLIALYAAGYREYIQSPLLAMGLESGKTYRFGMQLSLAEDSSTATDRIGAYFSTTAISSTSTNELAFAPQVETPAGTFLDDTVEWMSFTDTFVAAGGEQYVTIGNFHDDASSASIPAGLGPNPPLHPGAAYYYVDWVSLVCEPCTEPPNGLTAWWPLDETAGSLAVDVVGAQHGVHVGAPVPVPGLVDGSLDFFESAVSVATTLGLEFHTGDFSLDAWVRPAALGTTQVLLSKIHPFDPVTGPGYALALNADGTVTFTMVDAALGVASGTSTAALVPGSWSHVTVTVDREDSLGGKIHVDGSIATFDPTSAMGSIANTLPLLFASDGGAGVGSDLIGSLDEVEVFARALEESEVLALYQSRTSGKCKAYLELEPITVVVVATPGTVGTTGELTNSGGSTGTFTVSVRGDAAGTKCGSVVSNTPGPSNPRVLTQQPIQVPPGTSVPVAFEFDIAETLSGRSLACYTVTTTQLETGRTFLSRGVLRGPGPRWLRTGPSLGSTVDRALRR